MNDCSAKLSEARDIRYHLHSYTDAVRLEAEGPLVIERGDGIYVEDVTASATSRRCPGFGVSASAFRSRVWRKRLRGR